MKYILKCRAGFFEIGKFGLGKLTRALILGLLVSFLASPAGILFSQNLRTVVLTGAPAPGTSDNVVFSEFINEPLIDGEGNVAFNGLVAGAGVNASNDGGIWSEAGGKGLKLVMRESDQAPGTNAGVVFSSFSPAFLTQSGNIAFRAVLAGSGVNGDNDGGIWSDRSGNGLMLVVREQDPAPGTNSSFQSLFGSLVAVSDDASVAFGATLTGADVDSTNDRGIWSDGGGDGLRLVAREGEPAPGTETFIGTIDTGSMVMNASEQIAFAGRLGGLNGVADDCIWSESGGNGLELIAREGNPAPGTAANFEILHRPVINDAGQVAFLGNLDDGFGEAGIWKYENDGRLNLVARTSDPAPGTNHIFGGNWFNILIDGAGNVSFLGSVEGEGVVDGINDRGLWSQLGGTGVNLIVLGGDPASGTEVSFTTGVFQVSNAAGQKALRGSLIGDNVDETNDNGIWASDLNGDLVLIAREGEVIDVNDDPEAEDLRTISALDFIILPSGGQDGSYRSFNDRGQIAFGASFTDGSSGIFVSNKLANLVLLGDVNGDSIVDLLDIGPFVEILEDGAFQFEADTNQDGVVDLFDVAPFVEILQGQ